jgi:hypothetical protein
MAGHRSWLCESWLDPQTAMKIRNKSSLRVLVATLLCAAAAARAEPATTDTQAREQKLVRRVAQLAQQLQEVQAELKALMAQVQATGAARQAPPRAPVASSAPAMTLPAASSRFEDLSLWGYGEIYYTHPGRAASLTEFDLARAVFGIGNKFDDRTLFNSEYEVEHAVSSAHDVGEFEVEQFYVDRQLSDRIAVRAGLFLMPFGLLNEYHEPTNFYGVQRNFVETLIIPSTWREGGLGLHGDADIGLSWNAGITSDQDLSHWDFAPQFPQYATALELEDSNVAPLQATHQELSLAKARHLAQYLALNYNGAPGLKMGASVFTGKLATVPAARNAATRDDQQLTLWETHARWTRGNFAISALYVHGSISNLADINAANPGTRNPIPSSFLGCYGEVAYMAWANGGYRLAPFARWEHYNMGASYEGVSGPFVPAGWPKPYDRVWTFGANYYLGPHVVLKADYQHFETNSGFSRYALGLGLNF